MTTVPEPGALQPDGLWSLSRDEMTRAAQTLADAFSRDPLWNWVAGSGPDSGRIRQAAFEASLRYCLKYGQVWAVSRQLEAVAAWVPGEKSGMTPWRMLASGAIWAALRMGLPVAQRMKPLFDQLAADRREHTAQQNYIYLMAVGVASPWRGQGLAGRLLRALLDEARRDRRWVYLETETAGNVGLYEHFGFRVVKQVTLPQAGLLMWEMLFESA